MLNDHARGVRDLGYLDVRCQRAGMGGHFGQLNGLAAQIAEMEILRASQGGAHVSRRPTAHLQGHFQKNRIGHSLLPIGFEIPGVRRHVVLALNDPSRFHLPGFCLDGGDPIQELVGRSGQPGDKPFLIEDSIRLAKRLGRLADRKSQNAIVLEQRFASLWSLVRSPLLVTLGSRGSH